MNLIEEKLIDLCNIMGGKPAPKAEEAFDKDGIPFVRMKDLGRYHLTTNLVLTDDKINKSFAKENNLNTTPKGAILLPRSGSVALNHRAILGQDSIIVSHICALVAKDESKISNRFLYYWLCRYDMNKIAKKTTGLDAINFSDLGNIVVSYPDLETQNKIVAILDKANALLNKREKTIAKYDELLRATFLEMFGDPVLNPKGWSVNTFGKVVSNKNSKRVPIKESDRDKRDGEYPYYGATGIIDYIDDYKFDGEYLLIAEDGKNLLFNRKDNAFLATGKFWVNNHAHVLSENGMCSLIYLLYFLNLIDLKPYITGIDQVKLNKNNLDKIPVPVPPVDSQKKFDSIFQKYQAIRNEVQTSLNYLNKLNEAITQLAFRGELVFTSAIDLEIFLERNLDFFQNNIDKVSAKSIQQLLGRVDKNELNDKKFYEPSIYDKGKIFIFELLKEGKVQQVFDEQTKNVKIIIA